MDIGTLAAASDDGWAMTVGTVDGDGLPVAGRAWAVRAEAGQLRVAIDAYDHRIRSCLDGGAGIAITASDVRTLRTVQLKGRCDGVEAAQRGDVAAAERNVDRLIEAIDGADRTPARITSRFVPGEYVVCRVRPAEMFDQTPGPEAGGRWNE